MEIISRDTDLHWMQYDRDQWKQCKRHNFASKEKPEKINSINEGVSKK